MLRAAIHRVLVASSGRASGFPVQDLNGNPDRFSVVAVVVLLKKLKIRWFLLARVPTSVCRNETRDYAHGGCTPVKRQCVHMAIIYIGPVPRFLGHGLGHRREGRRLGCGCVTPYRDANLEDSEPLHRLCTCQCFLLLQCAEVLNYLYFLA